MFEAYDPAIKAETAPDSGLFNQGVSRECVTRFLLDQIEDAQDTEAARKALASTEPTIPWDQVKKDLGCKCTKYVKYGTRTGV